MFKRRNICFGLLLACSIIFGFSLNASSDASALSLSTNSVNFNYQETPSSNYIWSNTKTVPGQGQPVGQGSYLSPIWHARYLQLNYASTSFQGNHASLHFETNVVYMIGNLTSSLNPKWINLNQMSITSCLVNGSPLSIESQALSYTQTPWQWDDITQRYKRNTLTIYGDVVVSGVPSGSGSIVCNFGSSAYAYFEGGDFLNDYIYVEQNPTSLVFSNNLNDALLNQQIAQNEVLIQLQQQEQEQNQQAYDNISNQSANDIQGATSQQTTNIIGTISSFVTALGTISSGSCDLEMPFPQFVGGTITVNPCNYKEKAPTIVTIGSSLLLIGIFIPLAFIVLKMIYNEIRSWTNG